MSNDNKPRSPKESLLGELESIKSLLDDDGDGLDDSLSDEFLDIPILEDVVPELSNNQQNTGLLDLDNIFEDGDDDLLIDSSDTSEESPPNIEPPLLSNVEVANAEADEEPEASLKIDHLDADISFPEFTLDASEDNNEAEQPEHPLNDLIPTLEPNMFDSDSESLHIEMDEPPLNEEEPDSAFIEPATQPRREEEQVDLFSHLEDKLALDDGEELIGESETETPDEPASMLEDLMGNYREQAPSKPSVENTSSTSNEEYDLDLMIQELVDEFIPPIEAELRKRLSDCSPAVIIELAKKHLDS